MRDIQCCRVLSQYHLNIHSTSDTRDVHVHGSPLHTHTSYDRSCDRVATHTVHGPLCQSIRLSHSNRGGTCTVHVLPLSPLPPSVKVSVYVTVAVAVRVLYTYCHSLQSIHVSHSNCGGACTGTATHSPTVRVQYTYRHSYCDLCGYSDLCGYFDRGG